MELFIKKNCYIINEMVMESIIRQIELIMKEVDKIIKEIVIKIYKRR